MSPSRMPAGSLKLSEGRKPSLLKEYVKTCLYSDLSMMTDTASLDAAQEYQTAAGGMEKKKDFERTVSETVQENLVSSAAVYSVKPILTRMPNRM